jgi:hypothetical protein
MNEEGRIVRNEMAKDINYEGEMLRTISYKSKQEFEVGQQLKLGQCWTDGGDYVEDSVFGKCIYLFTCKNGKGHKIDYDELTDEQREALCIYECESENEIVVDSETVFEIIKINSTDEDFEEMGFYDIEVKMIRGAENGSTIIQVKGGK